MFYHIRNKISINHLRKMYYAFIYSNLIYGIEIYGNAISKPMCKRLQIEQNRVLRTILRKNRYTTIDNLHKRLSILKIGDLIEFRTLQTLYMAIKFPQYLPPPIRQIIELNPHTHNTRNKNMLKVFKGNNRYGGKMYRSNKSQIWNELPSLLQNAEVPQDFKKFYKKLKLNDYHNP